MATVTICSRCGGTIGGEVPGKRHCACSHAPSGSVATLEATTVGKKICSVCGKDVTHAKRMKDGLTGRYWCYECGANSPEAKAHSLLPCPECNKVFPPAKLMKFKEHYICPHCYAMHHGGHAHPHPNGGNHGPEKPSTVKTVLIVGGAIIAVGLGLMYVMNQ